MQYILVLLVVAVILFLVFRSKPKMMDDLGNHWHHFFAGLKFSTNEFYALVEENIKAQAMPDVEVSRVDFSEGGLFSDKREYLRVERKDDMFDICAAPFGAGFFVSYWLGTPKRFFKNMVKSIPGVRAVSGEATYYKEDAACMFRGLVVSCVTTAIDEITTSKGIRGLTENERTAMNK
ncbi:MAG: hypothetical protein WCO63_02860 [Bacteroidota bacterium]